MLRRCYSEASLAKGPSYRGCRVSDEFLEFQTFAEWANSQVGFGLPKYHLDKDILLAGNRVYSSDIAVFVPCDLNVFLTSAAAKRGQYPQGVSWKTSHAQYVSQIKDCGVVKHLGLFYSLESAKDAYAKAKTQAGRGWGLRLRNGEFLVDNKVITTMENYEFVHKEGQ